MSDPATPHLQRYEAILLNSPPGMPARQEIDAWITAPPSWWSVPLPSPPMSRGVWAPPDALRPQRPEYLDYQHLLTIGTYAYYTPLAEGVLCRLPIDYAADGCMYGIVRHVTPRYVHVIWEDRGYGALTWGLAEPPRGADARRLEVVL